MKLLLFLKEFLIVHVCVSVYKGKHDENTLNECVVLSNKFNIYKIYIKIYVTHRLHVKLQTVAAFLLFTQYVRMESLVVTAYSLVENVKEVHGVITSMVHV
mgnify:CR=1 FL=1